jgi:hypothetical protein
MSRILNRPMFRLGGSTSGGITSGLDSPKLHASRPGYVDGNLVEERFKKYRGLYDKYGPPQRGGMPGSLSSFLMNTGINLASQSPTGNIIQTAATAAKQPLQQFQAARIAEDESQRRLNQAILGDVIETVSEEEQERIGGGGDIGAVAKINNEISRLNTTIRTLEEEAQDLETKQKNGEEIDEERLEILRGPNGLVESAREQLRVTTSKGTVLEQILSTLGSEWWMDRVSQYDTNPPETTKAAEEQARKDGAELLKGKAEGGRIGKQLGGEVSFEEDVEVEQPAGSRIQAAGLNQLDYTTLRARLPQEIGDDIVQLLAQSEEALTEFANIRTQEDVDQFNSEFNVNLVLPQEV